MTEKTPKSKIDLSHIPTDIIEIRSPLLATRYDAIVRLTQMMMEQVDDYEACRQLSNELEVGFADPLTKLPNKALLKSKLEQMLFESDRTTTSALTLIDIAAFSEINEKFSHEIGDHTLIGFTQSLKDSVRTTVDLKDSGPRATDLVASLSDRKPGNIASRFGGDEFAVIFTGFENSETVNLNDFTLRKVMKLLLGLKSMLAANGMNEFGVHANTVWIDPAKYQSYSDLIKAADPKLKDKQHEKTRVELTMQLEDGKHFFYDNVRRAYIDS